ncbi:MAG: UDP-diphospho-muramoylpentapeptide beta-N-acetylglucosaminyltransferase [Peptococcaceae bacterium BRH_c4b]|nr:MAG: UDP-diphospho-muramoylpentapeptide beta-N-acetylglucosaminyltransferase [Peptococcaceae bacterium BRH_c4b]
MDFVVTGGGTGGHIYPALAIARGLQEKYGARVHYIGGTRGMESDIVPREGFPFQAINLAGFKRSLSPANVLVAWRAARGVGQARKIIRAIQPAAVVGTGGYVCGPVVLAARLCGIPTLIHEQNALPGITNKMLSRFTDGVALTFEDSVKYFSRRARTKITGLPVRSEILEADRRVARAKLGLKGEDRLVLSFGGSQGAGSINKTMAGLLRRFCLEKPEFGVPGGDVRFLHVTGPRQHDSFMQGLDSSGIHLANNGNITVIPYLYDMPNALAASDLVICRAGAATLAELTVIGLPAILIPYPHAAGNHQEYNARALEKAGAAVVIRDEELEEKVLFNHAGRLLADCEKLAGMAGASKSLGKPRALTGILDFVGAILNRK